MLRDLAYALFALVGLKLLYDALAPTIARRLWPEWNVRPPTAVNVAFVWLGAVPGVIGIAKDRHLSLATIAEIFAAWCAGLSLLLVYARSSERYRAKLSEDSAAVEQIMNELAARAPSERQRQRFESGPR